MMNCNVCLGEIKGGAKYLGYHDKCIVELLGSLKISPQLKFSRKEFMQELPKQKTKGMSISGAQPKLSLNIVENKLEVVDQGGTYILKPSPEDFPKLAENEAVSMLIAKVLGISLPLFGLVEFTDGELAFLVKRFDRVGGKKLHQEDMGQILSRYEKDKYGGSYEEVGLKIKEINNGSIIQVHELLKRIIFSYFISNNDYHLKNISLLLDNNRQKYTKLTPLYDFVNSGIYDLGGGSLALEVFVSGEDTPQYINFGFFTKFDFIELGKRLGIPEKAILDHLDLMVSKKEIIIDLIKRSFLDDHFKEKYIYLINDRAKALSY